MSFLVDTDICSAYMKGEQGVAVTSPWRPAIIAQVSNSKRCPPKREYHSAYASRLLPALDIFKTFG